MIIKAIFASLIAGIIYTISIGLYTKLRKKKYKLSNIYLNGILFTILIFILFLILDIF